MSEQPISVTIDPTYVLREAATMSERLSYDPDLAVVTYQLHRSLERQLVQFVIPPTADGHAVAFELASASGGSTLSDGSTALPPIHMYQELVGDFVFTPIPDPTAGAPKHPNTKIKATIRVRPTGGG